MKKINRRRFGQKYYMTNVLFIYKGIISANTQVDYGEHAKEYHTDGEINSIKYFN